MDEKINIIFSEVMQEIWNIIHGGYDSCVERMITKINWLSTRMWYYDDPNSDSLMEIFIYGNGTAW
jgi:hypothetical protein